MIALPEMDALMAALDFKGILEKAIANVFKAANIKCLTTETAADEDFQSEIPRVEVKVTVGKGLKQAFALVNGVRFNASYNAALQIRAFSRPDKDGKSTHAQFKACIFYICHMLPAYLNGAASIGKLTRHQVHQPITQSGTSDVYKVDDGSEYSDLNLDFDFSALPAAFECLQMPTPNPNPNP